MKNILTVLSAAAVLILSGCAMSNSNLGYGGQPTGVVYANYNTPGSIANTTVKPVKSGEACTHGVLWVAAWGSAGTDDAVKSAGITKIANVQYSNTSILSGLYSKYCTVVTGQ